MLTFVVKVSRYFDHMAEADTIVFDKTGTLTTSAPEVESVVAYGGWSRDEALRLAACLEEHFPHPLARAVVNKAFEEGLEHREEHAGVFATTSILDAYPDWEVHVFERNDTVSFLSCGIALWA